MSDWWIYENWRVVPGGEAIVHKGSCPWCNQGRGIHWKRRKTSDKNGRWHGPYPTKNDALTQAQRLRRRETRSCKHCCHLSVQRVISCPDCGQPMTKNPKKAEYVCENPKCSVISVRLVGSSTRVLRSIEEKKAGNEADVLASTHWNDTKRFYWKECLNFIQMIEWVSSFELGISVECLRCASCCRRVRHGVGLTNRDYVMHASLS